MKDIWAVSEKDKVTSYIYQFPWILRAHLFREIYFLCLYPGIWAQLLPLVFILLFIYIVKYIIQINWNE